MLRALSGRDKEAEFSTGEKGSDLNSATLTVVVARPYRQRMTRSLAIQYATAYFDSGEFQADLARRVGFRTEGDAGELRDYLEHEMVPAVKRLGAMPRILDNPVDAGKPLLVAHRHEGDDLPTLLTYGHADVATAHESRWRGGLDPWRVTVEKDRWYGRGTADNKGQHTVNLAALEQVSRARGGGLGFNLTVLIETGEESGSPGLEEFCARHRDELSADLLIASDGPRVAAGRPTVFLGTRGTSTFTLQIRIRERPYQAGSWGGALRNPATMLASAIACLTDGNGRILVPGLRPPPISPEVRAALRDVPVGGEAGDPVVDQSWGEPGLTAAERVFGWNALEVLSLAAGNPALPDGLIPGTAHAHCQLRFVLGTDVSGVEDAVRAHLERHGFGMVDVEFQPATKATRTDPGDRWVRLALESLERTAGSPPTVLPNLGGSLPNHAFGCELGMPTIWIPHSHLACAQHAPDEHLLAPLAREALALMAGLFWDLGAQSRRCPG